MKFVHVLAIAAFLSAAPAPAQDAAYRESLRVAVERIRYDIDSEAAGLAAASAVAAFYERRSFLPAWREEGKIDSLLALIEDSFADGLTPADYHRQLIRKRLREARRATVSPAEWATFELLLTDALVSLMHHQRFGKANPLTQHETWNFVGAQASTPALELAEGAISAPSFTGFMAERIPRGPYYRRLRATLAAYRELAAAGGWARIPAGPSLGPDTTDERVPVLAARLAATGDLRDPLPYATGTAMDDPLREAVRRFQDRHGLEPDGIVGPATLLALNTPVEVRVQQLRLALERARWVLGGIENNFVAVNIAGFRIYVVADRQIDWESRVVVGKAHQQTPVFRGELQYVVFNPSWSVPYSIATRELLPQIQADPEWFLTHDYEVRDRSGARVDPAAVDWPTLTRRTFEYGFVQPPGPNNALGQVKFVFPNEHTVYLHDTPARQLFSTAARAFSHGCIRVENPLQLAEILLQPNGWDRARIDAAVASGKTVTVYLAQPLPILLLYWTANVDPDGVVHFFPDVYRRDPPIADALDGSFRID